MHWNDPLYYLSQAWETTHSVWGKICLVVFYSFVWLNIFWSLAEIVNPWDGYECVAAHTPDSETFVATTLIRGLNLFSLGFFLLANGTGGGIQVGNVAMVFLVNTAVSCWPVLPCLITIEPWTPMRTVWTIWIRFGVPHGSWWGGRGWLW
ncbi:hypothetical protein ACA910_013833 [Epithemia clementina (nom. ined.)]